MTHDLFTPSSLPPPAAGPTARTAPSPRPGTHGIALLPRHWAWLAAQPRSPSATLRRLIDAARRDPDGHLPRRDAQEACYRFVRWEAGDRPGFEAAVRALYAGDARGFGAHTAAWPADVRDEARRLAHDTWPDGPAP